MGDLKENIKLIQDKKREYESRDKKYLEFPIFCQNKVNTEERLKDLQSRYVQAGMRIVDRKRKDKRNILKRIEELTDQKITMKEQNDFLPIGDYYSLAGIITNVKYGKVDKNRCKKLGEYYYEYMKDKTNNFTKEVVKYILVCSPKTISTDGEHNIYVSDHVWLDLEKTFYYGKSKMSNLYIGQYIWFAGKINNYGKDKKRFGFDYWLFLENGFLYSDLKHYNIRVPQNKVELFLKDQTPIFIVNNKNRFSSPALKEDLIESMQSILNRQVNVNMFGAYD